jgi:hypothetical protein
MRLEKQIAMTGSFERARMCSCVDGTVLKNERLGRTMGCSRSVLHYVERRVVSESSYPNVMGVVSQRPGPFFFSFLSRAWLARPHFWSGRVGNFTNTGLCMAGAASGYSKPAGHGEYKES